MAVDSKKPADTGGGGERKRLDAPDFIYISGFSEERLRLREFVRSRWLSGFIYLVIIFNTIIMAMDDVYASRTKDSIVQRISVFSDWAILAIFTVEMLLKMIGLGVGFRAPEDETLDSELAGYFASSWNRFDCFIVIISWILVPIAQVSGENVQNLVRVTRLARPLRALRDVRNLESVEMLLQTIPAALPAFMDVTNLLLFLLVVFSILTLNLWGLEGKMHGRCVVAKDRTDFAANLSTSGFLQQPAPVLCGKDGFNCDPGFVCSCVPEVLADGSIEKRPYKFTDPVRGDTGCLWQGTQRPWTQGLQQDEPICPDFGFTCWDSFPLAMFTHFKVITLEGWSQTMWWSQASMNPWVAIVILVVLVILVTFNVVNLYVASISNAYRDVRKRHRDFDNKRKLERVQRKAEIQNEKDRLKKQREDLIAIGEDVEEEEEEEKKDTLLDKIIAIHERLKVHRDATDPISPLSLTVRKFMVYPLIVDECGTLVDYTICRLLAERNLEVVFGPAAGNWSIFVKRGKKARRLGEVKTNFGGEMVKNGHTKNHEQRVELKAAVQEFHISEEEEAKEANEKKKLGHRVIETKEPVAYADIVVLSAILLNAVSSAVDHYEGYAVPIDPGIDGSPSRNCCDSLCEVSNAETCARGMIRMRTTWRAVIFWVELVFNIFFTSELCLKLVSWWSIERFITENYPANILDIVIVGLSDIFFLLDLFIEGLFSVAVFRLFRLIRAVKMARRLNKLRGVLDKCAAVLGTLVYVLLILFLWHTLGALIGLQLFRCPVSPANACRARTAEGLCPHFCPVGLERREGEPFDTCYVPDSMMFEHCPWTPHRNFNTFRDSLLTLFFVTTGDNSWSDIIHRGMRSGESPIPGLIFFLSFFIISYYTICNLFISVILEVFETTDEKKTEMQLSAFRYKTMRRMNRHFRKLEAEGRLDEFDHGFGWETANPDDLFQKHTQIGNEVGDEEEDDEVVESMVFCFPQPLPNKKMPLERPNFRYKLRKFVESTSWTIFILLVIITSTIFLALDTNVPSLAIVPDTVAQIADYTFFVIFFFEFALKIVDTGVFLEGPKTYFRQSWNWLDFFLLLFQILDLLGLKGLRALRVLRVLRPLRLLNKIKSLQLLLTAMGKAVADISYVMLIWVVCFVVFAIVGVFLFGGRLHSCSDLSFVDLGSVDGYREDCAGNFIAYETSKGIPYVALNTPTGILKPRVWSLPGTPPSDVGFGFDNFFIACQTLFEASTVKLWSKYVYAGMDVTSYGQQPKTHYSPSTVIYWVSWVSLSCFFILQMIIGVLIDSINQETGSALFTVLQRNWIQMEQRMRATKPLIPIEIPKNKTRKNLWFLVNHPWFLNFMTGIIGINIILMATEHYDQSDQWTLIMTTSNTVFLAIYIVEIILKFIAFQLNFFHDSGNVFDLLVVISSIADEITAAGGGSSGLQALRVLRVLRVLRTLRIVRRSERLLLIFNTLVSCFSSVLSSLLFLALFVLLLAVVGNQFFSGLKFGSGINRANNFDTPWNGFLTVLVVITGDNWQEIMRSAAIQEPYCTSGSELERLIAEGFRPNDPTYTKGDCGSTLGAMIFFDLAYLLGFNILRSLFIAVLMESFFAFKGGAGFMISPYHVEQYRAAWRQMDPGATSQMPVTKLRALVENLHKARNPLGLTPATNEFKFQQLRMELTTESELGKDEDENQIIGLNQTLVSLGLWCVGLDALKYEAQLERADRTSWYGQLAACAKFVAIFRGIRQRRQAHESRMGLNVGAFGDAPTKKLRPQETSKFIADNRAENLTKDSIRDRREQKRAEGLAMRPPAPPATQQEIAAIKSNARDFDHAVWNLEEMRKRLAKEVAAENGAPTGGSRGPNGFPGWGKQGSFKQGSFKQGSFKQGSFASKGSHDAKVPAESGVFVSSFKQHKGKTESELKRSALYQGSEEDETVDPRARLRRMQYADVLSGAVHSVSLKVDESADMGYGAEEDMHIDHWAKEQTDSEDEEAGGDVL